MTDKQETRIAPTALANVDARQVKCIWGFFPGSNVSDGGWNGRAAQWESALDAWEQE